MHDTAEGQAASKGTPFTNVLNFLASLAAIAGVLYALGLVLFIFQLWTTFGTSFSTALFAASIVSQVVIVGQGLRVVWVEPLLSVALFGFTILSLLTVPERHNQRTRQAILRSASSQTRSKSSLTLGPIVVLDRRVFFWLAIVFFVFFAGPLSYYIYIGNWRSVAQAFVRIIIAISAPLAFYYDISRGRNLLWRLLTPVFILYFGLAFSALVGAQLDTPPLPTIQLYINGQLQQGRLVAHQDGYWYLFTEPDNQLKAISDSSVENTIFAP